MSYLLFGGCSHYPTGPAGDFIRSYPDEVDAISDADAIIGFDGLCEFNDIDWCRVIDSNGNLAYSLGDMHGGY